MEEIKTLNEIFALLRQGDKKGLEILYNAYYNRMYGIAFSVVKNEAMSEDVVHNVMYKFMTMNADLFPQSNETTWWFSVIKNEALMLLRKERKTISLEQIGEIGLEHKSIGEYVDLDTFRSMIKSLNDKQKTVVSLKILGGYTHKEIAKLLGKPIGTIQWLYNTSIKKIRSILTTLLSFICILSIGLLSSVYMLFNYEAYLRKDVPTESILLMLIILVVFFCIAIISLTVAFILFYKKSDKLPTKASMKSI